MAVGVANFGSEFVITRMEVMGRILTLYYSNGPVEQPEHANSAGFFKLLLLFAELEHKQSPFHLPITDRVIMENDSGHDKLHKVFMSLFGDSKPIDPPSCPHMHYEFKNEIGRSTLVQIFNNINAIFSRLLGAQGKTFSKKMEAKARAVYPPYYVNPLLQQHSKLNLTEKSFLPKLTRDLRELLVPRKVEAMSTTGQSTFVLKFVIGASLIALTIAATYYLHIKAQRQAKKTKFRAISLG